MKWIKFKERYTNRIFNLNNVEYFSFNKGDGEVLPNVYISTPRGGCVCNLKNNNSLDALRERFEVFLSAQDQYYLDASKYQQ